MSKKSQPKKSKPKDPPKAEDPADTPPETDESGPWPAMPLGRHKWFVPDAMVADLESLVILDADDIEKLNAYSEFNRIAATFTTTDVMAYLTLGWGSIAEYLGIPSSVYRTKTHLPLALGRGRIDLAKAYLAELRAEPDDA